MRHLNFLACESCLRSGLGPVHDSIIINVFSNSNIDIYSLFLIDASFLSYTGLFEGKISVSKKRDESPHHQLSRWNL